MAGVNFDRVSKIYPDGTRAVNQIELDIEDAEFMVLVRTPQGWRIARIHWSSRRGHGDKVVDRSDRRVGLRGAPGL